MSYTPSIIPASVFTDLADAKDDFNTAVWGEDVRDGLVEVDEAVSNALEAADEALATAIGSQLNTVTSDLTNSSATAAGQAKAVGDAIKEVSDTVDERTIIRNANAPVGFKVENKKLFATYKPGADPEIGSTGKRMSDLLAAAAVYDKFNDLSRFTHFNGTPTLSSSYYATPPTSMNCSGTSSVQGQFTMGVESGSNYYIACGVYCPNGMSNGKAGVSVTSASKTKESGFQNANTNFKNASVIFPTTSSEPQITVTVGTYSSANGTAYFDNLLIVRLEDVFTGTLPTYSELYNAFNEWLSGYEDAVEIGKVGGDHSLADCMTAFVNAMQNKADNIGMTGAEITSPSGADTDNVASAKDLLKMLTVASSCNPLCSVWAKKEYAISVGGENARTIDIETTVANETFEASYHILGGKTGSWGIGGGQYMNNLVVIAIDVKGRAIAGVITHATSDSNRFPAMKELFDIAEAVLDDPTIDTSEMSVTKAECAIAWALPNFNTAMCEGYEPPVLFAQEEDTVYATASTIKVLAIATAMDYISNLYDSYTMDSSDIVSGSGNVFQAGDVVRIIDLLYAMMLPSSNQAAVALAHYTGKIILDWE